MALVLTIAAATKTLRAGTLHIAQTANGRATASFNIVSDDASYRPALNAEVILTENGTPIFGGLIERATEVGVLDGALVGIVTRVSAVDYHTYTDRRLVVLTIAAGTLKAALTTLTSTYLATYGVTLHASQVNGPTLPQLVYDYRGLTDVLNELAAMTADSGEPFVWRIDSSKVLRMLQPSTNAAPFNITNNTPSQVIGDVEVEPSREHYANSVYIRVPNKTEMNRVETFTGNGSTITFTLQYTLFAHRGGVYVNNVFETLGSSPATWTYEPSNNTITRTSGAPANGHAISITFDGTYGAFVQAFDQPEIDANGPWERIFTVDTVPSDVTAQALADAELARRLPTSKIVKYTTHEAGVFPGQTQTITMSWRNLSGVTAMITEVVARDLGKDLLERRVTAVVDTSQTNLGRGWRDTYKQWSGDKSAGSASAVAMAGGVGGPVEGPAGGDKAVQYNDDGEFGGESDFTYDKNTNCLVAGSGGSSITAATPESCQVFGFNNHIADL